EDALADAGGRRPAPARAAGLGRDRRLTQGIVDLLHQQPSPAVGHSERARRARDRSGQADRLQQRDLAGPDAIAAREIDANGKARHGAPLPHDCADAALPSRSAARSEQATSDTALICAYMSCPEAKPSTRWARRVTRARSLRPPSRWPIVRTTLS